MSVHARWPASTLTSLLAGMTSWVALWSWSAFTEKSSDFLVPVLGAALLVAIIGALLRSVRLPALAVALAQVVVLIAWLDHRWASGQAIGGLLPTPTSLSQVREVLHAGFLAAGQYAAPVPRDVTALPDLLIVIGCAVAVVVDFLACGVRRVPLAGLPLLAVFSAATGVLGGGVFWGTFAVGAVMFLFLLAADETERLSRWGARVPGRSSLVDSQATAVSRDAVWSSARKIGFTATGLAVVVPILVPTVGLAIFDGVGPGHGHGDSVSISNPMVDMKRDLSRGEDVNLLSVSTPQSDPSYLRITVLDEFTGDAWRPSERNIPAAHKADRAVPRPPGLDPDVRTTTVPYAIETTKAFKSRWLPTPYPIASIQAAGDWRYDSRTFDFISADDDQSAADRSYKLQALKFSPSAQSLAASLPAPSAILSQDTALPQGMPPIVRDLALRVTREAPTRYQKAVRLQQWFRDDGRFTYSLKRASGNSLDQLIRFLGTGPGSRTGYCEQFSTAMALMGRSLGIPSRVAVGFLRGDQVERNLYVFSSHDLHAWPEMYFEGAGWVRFEPTPAARATAVPPYTREELPIVAPSTAPTSSAAAPRRNRLDRPETAQRQETATDTSPGSLTRLLVGAAWVVGIAFVISVPALLRITVRRRRWSSAQTPGQLGEAGWRELRDTARDLRIGWTQHLSVRSTGRALVNSFAEPGRDDALEALDRLVRMVERARYGRPDSIAAGQLTDAVVAQTLNDVTSCTRAMYDAATATRRMRARWLPLSLVSNRRLGRGGGASVPRTDPSSNPASGFAATVASGTGRRR